MLIYKEVASRVLEGSGESVEDGEDIVGSFYVRR